MNNTHRLQPCPYCDYNQEGIYNDYRTYPSPYSYDHYVPVDEEAEDNSRLMDNVPIVLKDYGAQPFVVNINEATKQNNNYRIGLWTGNNLQVTLMSIKVGDDIGLEVHPQIDQFIRIEDGQGIVKMGGNKDNLDFQENVYDDFAIMIPAGTWHNVINTGNKPLKVYSIYAPPQHPHGVVHVTKPAE
ncbi:MAG: cupin domain-containing protein [Clostridium sp.]|uniref:cupin domain-containing protein n=1 Tax=Clostridium sp. TaxID=1506 RepID=UPI0025BABA13|nr:cupin domain-containing protein [Clostridium sp.]MCE5222140.1 cupin domain-containing protein [Clostridium sp.]